MDIVQAVRSLKGYGWITRERWYGHLRICPTNEPECCICMIPGREAAPRCQPQAEDLAADDWVVCDQ